MTDLHRKYVLVTGCDTGIGRSIVEQLDQIGVHVFAGCLTNSAVEELKSKSSRIIPFILDVTKTADIENAVTLVKKTLPKGQGLWGVVNNAGISNHGFVEWTCVEDYRKVCQVNLFGLIDVTCHFLPLVKKEKGRIINMSSMAGIFATPWLASYNVSKFGIVAFNNTLRIEMLAFDVGVICICPTSFRTDIINTERLTKEIKTLYDKLSPEIKESYKGIPEQLIEGTIRLANASPTDISPIVNAVENALFSTKPKRFYYVGSDSMIYRIVASLPSGISDWIITTFNSGFQTKITKRS